MLAFSLFLRKQPKPHSPIKTALYAGLIMLAVVFTSCGPPVKLTTYFNKTIKKDSLLSGLVTENFESKIQRNDLLGISVSSMSAEMDQRFNSGSVLARPESGVSGYHVNERGMIRLHFIDSIKAEGLTRRELKQNIEKALLPFMKEPFINIQFLNHKVTIMGEVNKPQVINMPYEQMPLIDLIVSSGDVKEGANKKSIMVIREEKDGKRIKYLNLEDHSLFSSPWYHVQPNDIVYVLPDTERYEKEETRRKRQATFTFAASLISLAVVVLNFIVR